MSLPCARSASIMLPCNLSFSLSVNLSSVIHCKVLHASPEWDAALQCPYQRSWVFQSAEHVILSVQQDSFCFRFAQLFTSTLVLHSSDLDTGRAMDHNWSSAGRMRIGGVTHCGRSAAVLDNGQWRTSPRRISCIVESYRVPQENGRYWPVIKTYSLPTHSPIAGLHHQV